ncbi:DUF1684 domain-containing protein [Fodinibius sp. Rm-B-1B1-1]|uniref:DUF1684 domain-containing protein n=1 Tax=Fodinibius alkaliphilus TaxID=3140241 RepID=UPI003159C411
MNFIRTILSPIIGIFVLAFIVLSCNFEPNPSSEYVKEVNDWHQKRINNLKGPEDWLKLAGLFEIHEGTHTFGSDSTNDIIFPSKAAPEIGTITKNDTIVTVEINDDVTVTQQQDTVTKITMTPGNARSGTVLAHQSFRWYLLDRRGMHYIRLVDEKHPNIRNFDGIERFPIKPTWKIKAQFNAFDEPRSIIVPDVLNEGMPDTLYGMLEFTIDGKEYSLAPLNHPEKDDKFFIIYGDKTNGETTYGGGKYIYIPTPNEDGITYLDFNKSYNPPCVFTEFATCPLPPAQNRLPIAIPAGEKMFENAQSY